MTQKSLAFPLLLGLLGLTLLVALGLWQMQRLAWKLTVLDTIDQALAAAPVALPGRPDPARHNYLATEITGSLTGEVVRVLTSRPGQGPGHRIIAVLETDGRRILADLGFQPERPRGGPLEQGPIRLVGNMHWPDETDRWFTPAPEGDLWFARDVPAMAAALGTDPVLVVRRASEPLVAGVDAWPVDRSGIRNTHFEYAMTWFGLAGVWAVMTGLWVFRIGRRGRA